MREGWDADLKPSLSARNRAIHEVLQEWFERLEDGTTENYLPDFSYSRTWTEEELQGLVTDIDTYVFAQHNWVRTVRFYHTQQGPGYARLAPPQRLAFAQHLDTVSRANPKMEEIIMSSSAEPSVNGYFMNEYGETISVPDGC